MITVKDIAGLAAHLEKKDPHGLEKADVGLSNVLNYRVATSAEAKAGKSNTLYMTPLRTNELATAIANGITKSTLGLGAVQNYGIATQSEAIGGKSNTSYMTPLRTKELATAIANGITKSTLGLGNVANYGIATQAEAIAGTVGTEYMTPLRVKQAIDAHKVTKSSLGLGNVANYGIATQSEAEAGNVNTEYMTPLRVKQAINALAASGGDSWEINAVDNGLFGYARHVETGLCLQWGQTPAIEEEKAVICYYRRPFTTRPFAITTGDLGWTSDSPPNNPRELAEVRSSIAGKSITESRFVMVTNQVNGKNIDGIVMSWMALGFSAGGVTLVSENSRCVLTTSIGTYGYGAMSRGAGHIVAPYTTTGGGAGGGTAPGGGGCIVYDVVMPLHDGTIKLAEDIKVGDRLPTRHFKDMPMGEDKEWLNWSTEVGTESTPEVVTVTAVRKSSYTEYFILNDTLKITRQHEILVGKQGVWKWLDVRDIEEGDYLLDARGEAVVVKTKVQVNDTISVFDFDVEEIDTYIAGGYLVHNAEQVQK